MGLIIGLHPAAGSVVGFDGKRKVVRECAILHEGEVALESYGYISSVENHAPLITRMMSEGMSALGMSRASDTAWG